MFFERFAYIWNVYRKPAYLLNNQLKNQMLIFLKFALKQCM